jgi:O-antigen/teichoic acid export membrane protein
MLGAIRRRIPSSLSHLLLSRALDQGVMAAASLLLARVVGPENFAPIAVLLVVNSLAVQVSDFGVGFAVLRTGPGEQIAVSSLSRLRRLSVVVSFVGLLVGVVLGGTTGIVLGCGGVIWGLSAEAYVRKSAAIRLGASREVAFAEIIGAVAVLAGVMLVWRLDLSIGWFALALIVKHLAEIVGVRTWRPCFGASGDQARSGPEWVSQVLTYGVANVDYLVVVLLLTPAELSSYVVAFRMASALPALVGGPITNTAFVELADAAASDRPAARRRVVRRARLVGIAGAVGVLLLAPVLAIFLGSAWAGTGWLVAILAPAVPFRMLLGAAVANAITLGGARSVVVWEFGRLVAVGLAAAIGGVFGVVPAAALVSAATIVSLTVVHRLSVRLSKEASNPSEWGAAAVAVLAVVVLAVLAAAATG